MTGRKEMDDEKRNAIVQFLLQNLKNGKPAHGKMLEARNQWAISKRSLTRLWSEAKKLKDSGVPIYLRSKKINRKVKKRVLPDMSVIQSVELRHRGTIRALANFISVSKSTVARWISSGMMQAHTSAIKPNLIAPNKLLRLKFSLDVLVFDAIERSIKFKCMANTVHIDEKWFYITRGTKHFYLTPEKADPHRGCQNKKFITKVMFMCVVCRLVFDVDGSVIFYGKIGIFPLTYTEPAKRSSKNRPAGTLIMKLIESITKQVIKACMMNQIIPTIKEKWPAISSKIIFIQQDNAKPHISNEDPDFRSAASSDGFDIRLIQQPANSPDLNVNNLGWFRAIQSIQVRCRCISVPNLVDAVILSFEQLTAETLNKVFLSLQSCMMEIMKVKGSNNYRIPHMNKSALIRQQILPTNLSVLDELIKECVMFLIDHGFEEYAVLLLNGLGIQLEGDIIYPFQRMTLD